MCRRKKLKKVGETAKWMPGEVDILSQFSHDFALHSFSLHVSPHTL